MVWLSIFLSALFFYCPSEKEGMHVAELTDSSCMHIGQVFASDYGNWGQEKRMYNPFIAEVDGAYVAVFSVNDVAPCFAVAYSTDLFTWRPQDYPRMSAGGCVAPVVSGHDILFMNAAGQVRKSTADGPFRHFTTDIAAIVADIESYNSQRSALTTKVIDGKEVTGQVIEVTAEQVQAIKDYFTDIAARDEAARESLKDDPARYAAILGTTQRATLTINGRSTKDISDKLMGIFFEDISYAADGGLYAEQVQNRDFEYSGADSKGWTAATAWRSSGPITISTDDPLTAVNPHHITITADTLWNSGWDGIRVADGAVYDLSFFAKGRAKKSITFALVEEGKTIATTVVKTEGNGAWTRYEGTLTATATATAAELQIVPQGADELQMDMISLFPQETFGGHKNGLRKDLAETIAAIHPRFIRFPGGCMSHGDGLDNIYRWTETIGPLEERTPAKNIWKYHQTRGLGFYELFLFCEDIAAEPLPVLAAAVPCQNSKANADNYGGQQGGIPEEEMEDYINEILALIEWANGDPATSEWAKKRADAGHEAPFNLKYIGIGNEDIISTTFEDRCARICRAIKQKYPEITIIGTVGPFHYPSSDYIEGWRYANDNADVFDMVDEHYYESVGWFINNRNYYDSYDRAAPKVYLGEYAARQGKGDIDCALAEALYLTDIERNGDVVMMTSYAPMLSKNGHSNWSPDMIYFSNAGVTTTPSYHTQRLFATYSGNKYIASELSITDAQIAKRIGASVVRDAAGQHFLKLVNILPVAVEITVEAKSLPMANIMRYEGFSGVQGQTSVEIERGTIRKNADGTATITIPPYALRVVTL